MVDGSFHMYVINATICLYGLLLFVWWWRKTGKATRVYRYVTLLFAAGLIEKGFLSFLRYALSYSGNPALHNKIITSWWWPLISLPNVIAFGLIAVTMSHRIWRTNKAVKDFRHPVKRQHPVKKSVLVISKGKGITSFLRGVFITNQVVYYQADGFIDGLDIIVSETDISIVLLDLRVGELEAKTCSRFVQTVKKERPWMIVIAMTKDPSMYELLEVRRSFFDDYLHLPVQPDILMNSFDRWCARINRWKNINNGTKNKEEKKE